MPVLSNAEFSKLLTESITRADKLTAHADTRTSQLAAVIFNKLRLIEGEYNHDQVVSVRTSTAVALMKGDLDNLEAGDVERVAHIYGL